MKKIIATATALALASTLSLGLAACGSSSQSSSDNSSSSSSASSSSDSTSSSSSSSSSSSASADADADYISTVDDDDIYATGTHHVTLKVKGYDAVTLTLDADSAPVTVSSFCKLVKKGYYDGLTFHRIVDEFCLQGGDPKGNGTGGSGQAILGEFSANGVDNKLADNYERGTLGMARSTDANSGEGQFFITLSDTYASSLNGNYAAFGSIDKKGMKVIDQIVSDYLKYADEDQSGTITKTAKQPKIASMKIVD